MFVSALKQSGTVCAVTGDGINDAMALSEANVGFCMGSGCAVAKDHADIIFTDDNFESVMKAVKWGRNIIDNCRKFIQFQLTCNLSCFFIVMLAGATLGQSPFSIIQLLWINLVMDVFAAIALATEAPHPTQLKKERTKKNEPMILPIMWRTILSQFLYQALVMVVLLYAGPWMFGIGYNLVDTPLYTTDFFGQNVATYRLQHQTLMFQTFMMMNIFNMFNSRKIGSEENPEFNVMDNLFGNWWLIIIVLGELNAQFLMIGYPTLGLIFVTTPLTLGMHLTAFLLGLSVLGVSAAVKASPFEWT